jgi:hypothetical protein
MNKFSLPTLAVSSNLNNYLTSPKPGILVQVKRIGKNYNLEKTENKNPQ